MSKNSNKKKFVTLMLCIVMVCVFATGCKGKSGDKSIYVNMAKNEMKLKALIQS